MTDAEGENILRALAGEPEPPPRVVHNWAGRWAVFYHDEIVLHGGRRKVGRWVREWLDAEWDAYLRLHDRPGVYMTDPGPATPVIPWLVHADCNKAHKCPVCKSYAGINEQLDATDGRVRYWHVYICEMCGQRFARRFYLHEHPCDGHRWEYWDHFKLFWRTAWSQKYYHGPRWWTHGLSIRIEHAVWDWQDRRKERKRKDDQKRA